MVVTVLWFDPVNLETFSKVLARGRMCGRQTFENNAKLLDKILDEFNMQSKTTLIVTDIVTVNFMKAFRYVR